LGDGSAGAKVDMLHCVGFERGDAALLILLKRWHFDRHIFRSFILGRVVF
jgi:hypothetical protein